MLRRIAIPCLVVCLLLVCSGADKPKTLHFLSPDAINITQLIADPPSRGSEEDRAEIDVVLVAQKNRTPEQEARAQAEDKLTVFAFDDVLGPSFSAKNYPELAEFFADAEADSKVFSKAAKEHWARPRPPVIEPRVKPVTKLEVEGSYPSGHSTRGTLFAEVLSELFPEKRDALLDRGRQIGWDRVIAGVHYPSDVVAGRILGHNLARVMLTNAEFQSRLEKVRAELSHAHAATPAVSAR